MEGGGGGGALDRVVMERKTQEEGFADPDRAVTSALKNVCVSECVSVSEKKLNRKGGGQKELSLCSFF